MAKNGRVYLKMDVLSGILNGTITPSTIIGRIVDQSGRRFDIRMATDNSSSSAPKISKRGELILNFHKY